MEGRDEKEEVEGKGGREGKNRRMIQTANITHTHTHRMLVCRGADADSEDKDKRFPSFLAQWCQALECHQIIHQHLQDRAVMLAEQAKEVRRGGREGYEGGWGGGERKGVKDEERSKRYEGWKERGVEVVCIV